MEGNQAFEVYTYIQQNDLDLLVLRKMFIQRFLIPNEHFAYILNVFVQWEVVLLLPISCYYYGIEHVLNHVSILKHLEHWNLMWINPVNCLLTTMSSCLFLWESWKSNRDLRSGMRLIISALSDDSRELADDFKQNGRWLV